MLNINPTDIANDLRKSPSPRVAYGRHSVFDHVCAALIATGHINELRLQVFLALFNKQLENLKNETTSKNTTDSISE